MPYPYHNTNPPTPNTKNNINDISVYWGIRDFLLNKNLKTSYKSISTAINGSPRIGEPVLDTSVGNGVINPHIPLEDTAVQNVENATMTNRYKDDQPVELTSIETITPINIDFPNTTKPNGTPYSVSDTEKYGILAKSNEKQYRTNQTLKNLYLDTAKQIDIADFISSQPNNIPQKKGYMDEYGNLNLGQSNAVRTADIIGSFINGQGVGFNSNGIVPNFDLRASLAGRVLGGTGILNDTKLGIIGAKQLALALANNAAFNAQQLALGTLNVEDNLYSLIKGNGLTGLRPNYSITVASSNGGKVLDYTQKILGFTIPRSELSVDGSIFLSESDSANIQRANSMLRNTGKGQVLALLKNMNANINGTTSHDSPDNTPFRSGYAPGYTDNRGRKAIDTNLYAFGDKDGFVVNFITTGLGVIPEISYNREKMVESYGFKSFDDSYVHNKISTPTFTWGSSIGEGTNSIVGANIFPTTEKKSLLAKTQMLFNHVGMKTIVSTKGSRQTETPSQIQTAVVNGFISKGSAVKSQAALNGEASTAEDTFCRSWTTLNRYDKVRNLGRHRGLYTKGETAFRYNTENSVLDDNGFVKIAPYRTDDLKSNVKKYMLSLENLAWAGSEDMTPEETGPGDLISGVKGKIMWFPPYELNFSENSNVSLESTSFIGRGEPVYTYNNTERTGTLSFKLVVDHPSYLNALKDQDDDYISSFFAGCNPLDSDLADKLTIGERSSLSEAKSSPILKKEITREIPPDDFKIYFPNDISKELFSSKQDGSGTYEDGKCNGNPVDGNGEGCGLSSPIGSVIMGEFNNSWADNTNFGLNAKQVKVGDNTYTGVTDPNFISGLSSYLKEKCPSCKVTIEGFASSQGNIDNNELLATQRATSVGNWFKSNILNDDTRIKIKGQGVLNTNISSNSVSAKEAKEGRCVRISFKSIPEKTKDGLTPDVVEKQDNALNNVKTQIRKRFYHESEFFEKLQEDNPFVYDSIKKKIKYFHPAFHSTTPEGFNSRLTFLHQCTRQGPTISDGNPTNLVFGRPPVCILRVGDLYNTKIMIESLGITYDPIVWDLNPEGIGVQPMIANIDLSFKFIGGSALMGPINKLQNALSFNYFANTQVYDKRSDTIIKSDNKIPGTDNFEYVFKHGEVERETLETLPSEPSNSITGNDIKLNQEANSNNNSSGVQQQTVTSTDPKILGFKNVTIDKIGTNNYSVSVAVKTDGIHDINGNQIISDDDLKKFANKGIRVSLDLALNPSLTSRTELMIDNSNFKSATSLLGVKMDSTSNLIDGNYILSISYNGRKINSISVVLSDKQFKYSN